MWKLEKEKDERKTMMETAIRIKKEATVISTGAIEAKGAVRMNSIPTGRTVNPMIGMANRLERSAMVEIRLK